MTDWSAQRIWDDIPESILDKLQGEEAVIGVFRDR
jgi:hypothetical protein